MWLPIKSKTWSFLSKDEPEAIHIIEGCGTSTRGKIYIVVHEDAFELHNGETEISTKEEIEEKYNIKLI